MDQGGRSVRAVLKIATKTHPLHEGLNLVGRHLKATVILKDPLFGAYLHWLGIDVGMQALTRLYVCLWVFKIPQIIENLADYEICVAICFLNERETKAAEIRQQINRVYPKNVMDNEMTVSQQHAIITILQDGTSYVSDIDSINGTHLVQNGRLDNKLTVPLKLYRLHQNTTIRFGKLEAKFTTDESEISKLDHNSTEESQTFTQSFFHSNTQVCGDTSARKGYPSTSFAADSNDIPDTVFDVCSVPDSQATDVASAPSLHEVETQPMLMKTNLPTTSSIHDLPTQPHCETVENSSANEFLAKDDIHDLETQHLQKYSTNIHAAKTQQVRRDGSREETQPLVTDNLVSNVNIHTAETQQVQRDSLDGSVETQPSVEDNLVSNTAETQQVQGDSLDGSLETQPSAEDNLVSNASETLQAQRDSLDGSLFVPATQDAIASTSTNRINNETVEDMVINDSNASYCINDSARIFDESNNTQDDSQSKIHFSQLKKRRSTSILNTQSQSAPSQDISDDSQVVVTGKRNPSRIMYSSDDETDMEEDPNKVDDSQSKNTNFVLTKQLRSMANGERVSVNDSHAEASLPSTASHSSDDETDIEDDFGKYTNTTRPVTTCNNESAPLELANDELFNASQFSDDDFNLESGMPGQQHESMPQVSVNLHLTEESERVENLPSDSQETIDLHLSENSERVGRENDSAIDPLNPSRILPDIDDEALFGMPTQQLVVHLNNINLAKPLPAVDKRIASELEADDSLYNAATQRLDPNPSAYSYKDDDEVFMMPTQKIGNTGKNRAALESDTDESFYNVPTQRLDPRSSTSSYKEDEALFLMPTQKIHAKGQSAKDNVDVPNDDIFEMATQRIVDRADPDQYRVLQDRDNQHQQNSNSENIYEMATQKVMLSATSDEDDVTSKEDEDEAIWNKPTQQYRMSQTTNLNDSNIFEAATQKIIPIANADVNAEDDDNLYLMPTQAIISCDKKKDAVEKPREEDDNDVQIETIQPSNPKITADDESSNSSEPRTKAAPKSVDNEAFDLPTQKAPASNSKFTFTKRPQIPDGDEAAKNIDVCAEGDVGVSKSTSPSKKAADEEETQLEIAFQTQTLRFDDSISARLTNPLAATLESTTDEMETKRSTNKRRLVPSGSSSSDLATDSDDAILVKKHKVTPAIVVSSSDDEASTDTSPNETMTRKKISNASFDLPDVIVTVPVEAQARVTLRTRESAISRRTSAFKNASNRKQKSFAVANSGMNKNDQQKEDSKKAPIKRQRNTRGAGSAVSPLEECHAAPRSSSSRRSEKNNNDKLDKEGEGDLKSKPARISNRLGSSEQNEGTKTSARQSSRNKKILPTVVEDSDDENERGSTKKQTINSCSGAKADVSNQSSNSKDNITSNTSKVQSRTTRVNSSEQVKSNKTIDAEETNRAIPNKTESPKPASSKRKTVSSVDNRAVGRVVTSADTPTPLKRSRRIPSTTKDVDDSKTDNIATPMNKRTSSRTVKNDNSESTIVVAKRKAKDTAELVASNTETLETPKKRRAVGNASSANDDAASTSSVSSGKTDLNSYSSSTDTPDRTKRKLKPKVVFTMMDSPELESLIRRLGGTVVDNVNTCTVLVTRAAKRTLKLLTAVGQGKPICSEEWLIQCKKAHTFLDPWNYILQDKEAEKKWDFSLRKSLNRSNRNKLLEGYSFQLVVNNAADVLKGAIESSGGKVISRAPSKNANTKFAVVSSEECRSKYTKFLKQKPPVMVVAAEAIFDGVLRQELHLVNHLLK